MKLTDMKKTGPCQYEIQKEGTMNVPAVLFTDEALLSDSTEDRSIQQAKNVATLPGIKKGSFAMPDMHQGYGFPIGGVAAFSKKHGIITPGGIGFDINCGVRLMKTPLFHDEIKKKVKDILKEIARSVPVGIGTNTETRLDTQEIDTVLTQGCRFLADDPQVFESDISRCEENGQMKQADASKVSQKAKARGKAQLGTLGAGNHFIELQVVDEIYDENTAEQLGLKQGQILYMIHCGSRGLGHQVCSDYLRKIETAYPETIQQLDEKDLMYAPFDSKTGQEYFSAMAASANFAWANRLMIAKNVRNILAQSTQIEPSTIETIYDVAHNIAKLETHTIDNAPEELIVHRKGATRAFPPHHPEIPADYETIGQPVIIPGSMGTHSYLLIGTEGSMHKAFGSAPHGAGRKLSRKKAMQSFSAQSIRNDLETLHIELLGDSDKGITQEAPSAYKDIDDVISVTKEAGLAKPVLRLRPIGVING
jgi:tRNA-splicing ligase RtcB